MKKLAIIIATLILILIIYSGIYYIQYHAMKNSFIEFYGLQNITEEEKPYSFLRCNNAFWNPEFAYLTGGDLALIAFYRPSNIFSQTKEEWEASDIGGTMVKNSSFKKLIQMIKEDCAQFQKSYGDSKDKAINWVYSRPIVETSEPEKTERQLWVEKASRANMYMQAYYKNASAELKELFHEIYGNPTQMEFEERVELFTKIINEGLNPEYEERKLIESFTLIFKSLSSERKKAFIETLGEWKGLPKEQLLEYAGTAMFNFTSEEKSKAFQ